MPCNPANISPVNTKRQRANWIALLLGLTATGGVVTAYCTGQLDWLEYKTLDLRFIYANSIRERDDLVLIRIDDIDLLDEDRFLTDWATNGAYTFHRGRSHRELGSALMASAHGESGSLSRAGSAQGTAGIRV